ncbi:MAG: hypothetical protein A3G75_07920 [Verrucomicrobia bacterium RIFCSPLOWO2_12_FULL_64_8]|nr:MAG: hypothetical protein A3G75_07920 [Verrucomicrobia bacterium RIFCSPLOWO2_12_FULL_64_8]
MVSDVDRAGGSDTAFGVDARWPNEPVDVGFYLRQWGDQFEPALGFIERRGVREYSLSGRYTWRPNLRWLRRVELGAFPDFTTDLENRLVAVESDAPVLTLETPAGDVLKLECLLDRDVLDEPFAIRPGIVIPPGNYSYWRLQPELKTSEARPVSARLWMRTGEFYTGNHTELGGSFEWHPSRHFFAGATYEHRDVSLREGDFEVHLASLRLHVAVGPDLTWSTVMQYDNLSDDVGLNSRVRWTIRPGSDVFLVWNQGWNYDDSRFRSINREVVVKICAAFRF